MVGITHMAGCAAEKKIVHMDFVTKMEMVI